MATQADRQPLRVVQITDTHLYGDAESRLLKLNTRKSMEQVLDLLADQESAIDLLLATGDIAQDASPEAYHYFARVMKRFDCPFYWIPGNHDRRSVMQSLVEYQRAQEKCIRIGNWQILMLDSSVPGEVHGRLDASELSWLQQALEQAEQDPEVEHSLVCLHHNPHVGTADWMEGIGLHNAEDLFAIIQRYASVRAVLYGHIHQALDYEVDGIRYLCSPSTCIQFKPGVEDFALDERAPAYRWLELGQDGQIYTGVERVPNFDLEVDHSSAGY